MTRFLVELVGWPSEPIPWEGRFSFNTAISTEDGSKTDRSYELQAVFASGIIDYELVGFPREGNERPSRFFAFPRGQRRIELTWTLIVPPAPEDMWGLPTDFLVHVRFFRGDNGAFVGQVTGPIQLRNIFDGPSDIPYLPAPLLSFGPQIERGEDDLAYRVGWIEITGRELPHPDVMVFSVAQGEQGGTSNSVTYLRTVREPQLARKTIIAIGERDRIPPMAPAARTAIQTTNRVELVSQDLRGMASPSDALPGFGPRLTPTLEAGSPQQWSVAHDAQETGRELWWWVGGPPASSIPGLIGHEPSFGEVLWELHARTLNDRLGRPPTMLIMTDEFSFPWEHIWPHNALGEPAVQPLGQSFAISRWHHNAPLPGDIDVGRGASMMPEIDQFSNADGSRKSVATAERATLNRFFSSLELEPPYHTDPTTLPTVRTTFADRQFQVLHLRSHGDRLGAKVNAVAPTAVDGPIADRLIVSFRYVHLPIRGLNSDRDAPLAVLNICGGGMSVSNAWRRSLIASGVAAAVVPMWDVASEGSYRTLDVMYEYIGQGLSVAESVCLARRIPESQFVNDLDYRTTNGYLVLGHPNTRVIAAPRPTSLP